MRMSQCSDAVGYINVVCNHRQIMFNMNLFVGLIMCIIIVAFYMVVNITDSMTSHLSEMFGM